MKPLKDYLIYQIEIDTLYCNSSYFDDITPVNYYEKWTYFDTYQRLFLYNNYHY